MHVMETEPFTLPADLSACTCSNLRKATRAVTQAYDDALRPVGLRATQFTLLATLNGHGKMPLTKLSEALGMDRTTLTRNLKPLMRREMIRTENEEDQRVRMVSLTDTGKRVFEEARPRWEEMQMRMSQELGQERWSRLLKDLNGITAVVRDG
jgi:DNA-binding MarR family transcriptional regulator